MKTKLRFKGLPKDYPGLLSIHMLRPIRDEVEYQNSLEVLEIMAGQPLNDCQEDYFEALALLVEAYESSHLPSFPKKDGLSVLKHLMEEHNFTGADLARLLGTDRSLAVRILNGERNLTVSHIKKIAARFKVPAALFLD